MESTPLTNFWAHIWEQLSPKFVVTTTTPATTPASEDEEVDVVAFLHALSVVHGEQTLSSRKYKLYVPWILRDDMYSHIPVQPSISMTIQYSQCMDIAVTKAGNLVVSHVYLVTETRTSILSVADGSVMSTFNFKGRRPNVDPEGRLWVPQMSTTYEVCCFAEDGHLLSSRMFPFAPRNIAFFSDGRVVFCGEQIVTDKQEGGCLERRSMGFYSSGDEEGSLKTVLVDNYIYQVKVCRVTNEVFALKKNRISVYSSEGVWLRDICQTNGRDIRSIELTCNRRIVACEYGGHISIWTDHGVLILKCPIDNARTIAVLPHGKLAVVNNVEIRIYDL